MYDYQSRMIAPRAIEYSVRTQQGTRIVRIYLHTPDYRIEAFHEANGTRSPATLWGEEIERLVTSARSLCFPSEQPTQQQTKEHEL